MTSVPRFAAGLFGTFVCASIGWLAAIALATLVVPGWQTTVISSGSMEPALRRGDAVLFDDTSIDRVEAGDVVVFDVGQGSIVHRTLREDADRLVTKGDANSSPDRATVDATALDGVARIAVPSIGLPRLWWTEGRVELVVAAGIALLVAARARRGASDPRWDPWRDDPTGTPSASGPSQVDWLLTPRPAPRRPLFAVDASDDDRAPRIPGLEHRVSG